MNLLVLWLLFAAPPSLDELLRRASADPDVTRACRGVDEWIAGSTDQSEIGRALLWEAQAAAAVDAFPLAEAALARIEAGQFEPTVRLDAQLQRADVTLLEGRPEEAARLYRAIDAPKDSRWGYVAELQARRALDEAARRRAAWSVATLVALVAVLGVGLGRRGLRRPPEELTYVAPVLALVAIASFTLSPAEHTAVLSLALGGAALVYAVGVGLREHPPRGLWRVVALAVVVAQSVGLLYSCLVLSGLWLRVADTLASGVE